MEEEKELKERAIEIFEDATFTLHKWQSNETKIEGHPIQPVDKEGTIAKQQLGEPCVGGSSLLGMGRNEERDELTVSFPEWKPDPTKRSILRKLASIYDPLGFGGNKVYLNGSLLDAPLLITGRLSKRFSCMALVMLAMMVLVQ